MAYRYDHTLYLSIGRNEVALEVVYSVTPGRPATGPSYACGGTPEEPAEVEIHTVEAVLDEWRFGKKITKREPVTGWLLDLISNCPDINADLLSEAGEEDSDRRAEYAQMRREDMINGRAA